MAIKTSKQHRHELLAELKALDDRAAKIRAELAIGKPGEEIWQWEFGDIDEDIVVIADGYGGASLQHVEGDGDNRIIKNSRDFATEEQACDLAGRFMDYEQGENPGDRVEYEDLWDMAL